MTIATTTEHQVLDPCLLGRPVHLLPQFAAQFGADLDAAMRAPGARRYWDRFMLESVEFVRAADAEAAGRWLGFACPGGTAAVALGRTVLLGVLNHRYGQRRGVPAAPPDPATVRVTATEERLAVVLAQQIAVVLAARIGANLASTHAGPATAPAAAVEPRVLPGRAPAKGSWIIDVVLRETHTGQHGQHGQHGQRGQYWLALDQGLMAAVLRGLLPERVRHRGARPSLAPLASALQLTLDARLVSKEITLDTLLSLKLGDIIPVSLGRAEVLLSESRLFSAAVSEHDGKLCLSSFKDVD